MLLLTSKWGYPGLFIKAKAAMAPFPKFPPYILWHYCSSKVCKIASTYFWLQFLHCGNPNSGASQQLFQRLRNRPLSQVLQGEPVYSRGCWDDNQSPIFTQRIDVYGKGLHLWPVLWGKPGRHGKPTLNFFIRMYFIRSRGSNRLKQWRHLLYSDVIVIY